MTRQQAPLTAILPALLCLGLPLCVRAQSPTSPALTLAEGRLTTSPAEDFAAAGLPLPMSRLLARQLAPALRPGAHFAILRTDPPEPGTPEALRVSLDLGRGHLALWRQPADAGPAWFDANGRGLRQPFLLHPLEGGQQTAGFGMRAHPLLGEERMHQGVDFAAPAGTPVLAAADGIVTELGFAGTYGRRIALRHSPRLETRYAHLAGFAPGLQPGDRVRQGDPIGQVGATGLATGPHLHFELLEGGRPVDPGQPRALPAPQLAGEALETFDLTRRGLARAAAAMARPAEDAALLASRPAPPTPVPSATAPGGGA